jgi:hypothetical protein
MQRSERMVSAKGSSEPDAIGSDMQSIKPFDATDGLVADATNDLTAPRAVRDSKPCDGASPDYEARSTRAISRSAQAMPEFVQSGAGRIVRRQPQLTLGMGPLLLHELAHQTYYVESDWEIRSPEDRVAYYDASELIQRLCASNGSRRRTMFPLPRDMGIIYWIDQFLVGTLVTADWEQWPRLERAARGALERMSRLVPVPQHVSKVIEAFDRAKNEGERIFHELIILREGWSYRDEPILGMRA